MWSYFGAKTDLVSYYPKPVHGKIIEPFAGSARYSLRYFENDVLLVDRYPVITDIWNFLQQASPRDILSLPIPPAGQTTDDLQYDIPAQKWLVGFIIHFGVTSPGKRVTPHYLVRRPNGIKYSLKRIADSLFKIRHWEIRQGNYHEIKNEAATWFIDPPYQVGGGGEVHIWILKNRLHASWGMVFHPGGAGNSL